MSAKIYFFPSDPQIREKLEKMPTEKRVKYLFQINQLQRKRYTILKNRLRIILAQRESQKN